MSGTVREHQDVVVGSGPCGYAAALGLAASGRRPLVVDFGAAPGLGGARLSRSSQVAVKGDGDGEAVFDYPSSLVTSSDGRHLPLSSARGGLSNIWGAGVLLRSAEELSALAPVYEGISDGYRALLADMVVAGGEDQTSERFPWIEGTLTPPQSARYAEIVAELQDTRSDVLFGHPRVALDVAGCVRCGECLTGCPKGLFFSSRPAVEALAARGGCELADGPARRIESLGEGCRIVMDDGEIIAERAYLAAGPVGTPALLQRSGLAASKLVVHDSAVFYALFINSRPANGDEGSFTAAQAVAYSREPGRADFQLALYDSNPEYVERLTAIAPPLGWALGRSGAALSKVNAGIGFLDSSVSGRLELTFEEGRTVVRRHRARGQWRRAVEVARRVARETRDAGLRWLPGAVIVPPPGLGYHSGSSLPMGGKDLDFDCRLRAAPGVYVVDASALPDVLAGAHTFTAMANAYRVGRLA